MKMKDVIKVGAGFLAGGLYVCWAVANGCGEGRGYFQYRDKNGNFKDMGKPLFDPGTTNKEEEVPE